MLKLRKKIKTNIEEKSKSLPKQKCVIAECMHLLGGAWTPNIIWQLKEGGRRFSELKSHLAPISAKMLSARLKSLEEKRIIIRLVIETSPPSVEYELTILGFELIPAIEKIAEIGIKIRDGVIPR